MTSWRDQVLAATAAVRGTDSGPLIGSAVLVEPDRLLTCRHVVSVDSTPEGALMPRVTVTFPGRSPLLATPLDAPNELDSVVLELVDLGGQEDSQRQSSRPVPIRVSGHSRAPQEVELVGYPSRDNTEDGIWRSFTVRGPAASGHIQLGWHDIGSLHGHSGGPVVDARTGELVGLLLEGSEIGRFDRYIPVMLLYKHGLLRWLPWIFEGDEAIEHFTRRARGQRGTVSASGDLFQGRTAALVGITDWLSSHEAPGRVLVISGQPGAGKSAVISRAGLAMAKSKQGDHSWHGLLFHARRATTSDFQRCLADLTGAADDVSVSSLLSEIDAIGETDSERRWVIIVDALDEAFSRGDRVGIGALLVELARRPWVRALVATRPLAAAGPYSPSSLLRQFGVTDGRAPNLIDLDSADYFELDDLTNFTQALLSQVGQPYPSPARAAWRTYRADPGLSSRLAFAVATRAGRNFLVAALTAARLSEQDEVCDPATPGFSHASLPASLGGALDLYLDSRSDPHRFRGILTALAYAEGAGMDDSTWRLSSRALGYPVTQAELDDLRTCAVADYLLETNLEHEGTFVRLFHRALNDQLLELRDYYHDQNVLVTAFLRHVAAHGGWAAAEPYMLRHLADHAAQTGRLSELLSNPDFLLRADLAVINARAGRIPPSDRPPPAWVTLRAGAAAYGLPMDQRARLLAIVAAHFGLLSLSQVLASHADILLQPNWAHTLGAAHTQLTGHTGGVQAVATVPMPDGHILLASASTDYTVRLWDPDTGQPVGQPWSGHSGRVQAVAAVQMPDGQTLLASASTDRTIRLWDPEKRQQIGEALRGHTDWVQAVAAVPMPDGHTLIASASDDGTVRMWDPRTGQPIGQMLTGTADPVWALAAITMPDGRTLLVSGGKDAAVRLWDPGTGLPVGQPMTGHAGGILALAVIPMPDGRVLLASASQDASVRLWDPETSLAVGEPMTGHSGPVWAVAAVPMPDGETLLASTGDDGAVKLWNPHLGTVVPNGDLIGHSGPVEAVAAVPIPGGRTTVVSAGTDGSIHLCDADVGLPFGNPLPGHTDWVWAMAVVRMPDGRVLLASGSTDGTVRLWDPDTGQAIGTPMVGHAGPVWAVAAVTTPDGTVVLASAGYGDEIRLWDPSTGLPIGQPLDVHTGMAPPNQKGQTSGHISGVEAVAALISAPKSGQPALLVSGGTDGTIRLWDVSTGLPVGQPLMGHTGMARALATVLTRDGRTLLASAGQDATVRLWDPADGSAVGLPMTGHNGPVSALAPVLMPDGRALVASGSLDATVRLWDPATSSQVGTPMTGHTGRIRAVAAIPLPDGRVFLASSGTDSTVRLWDPSTTSPIGDPTVVAESVTSMVVLNGRLAIASEQAICMLTPRAEAISRYLSS
jgi:WD40 repeat protein